MKMHPNVDWNLLILWHSSASNMPVPAAICLRVKSYLHIFDWCLTKCIWWWGEWISGHICNRCEILIDCLCAVKMWLEWLVSLHPREVWNPHSVLGWVPPTGVTAHLEELRDLLFGRERRCLVRERKKQQHITRLRPRPPSSQHN